MKISLCLMVWNELEGCRVNVPHLPLQAFEEVYAVDGGSNDGTIGYLQAQGITVYQQPKPGINAAYHHAVNVSTGEAVVVFFPKGSIDPKTLLEFRPRLEAADDLVIASRKVPGGQDEEDSQLLCIRKWGVLTLSWIASLIWRREGYRVKDVLHGYKGFTVAAFKQMSPLDHGISIDIEMVIKAYRLRLKRSEFPVKEIKRHFGKTHFKILPSSLKLLKYLLLELIHPEKNNHLKN
jgi:glycosyltransferase involved in cell wall biosynthesis